MSQPKEPRFFADRVELDAGPPLSDPDERRRLEGRPGQWRRGLAWYRSLFDPGFPVRGESSTVYSSPWYPSCAERIAAVVPEAKLVLAIRDPVERAISNYRYERHRGAERRPPEIALDPSGLSAQGSRLSGALERYRALFGEQAVLVIVAEDVLRDAATEMRRVFEFAGVEPAFTSEDFSRRWNVTAGMGSRRWRWNARIRELPVVRELRRRAPRAARWAIERLVLPRSGPPDAGLEVPAAVRARLCEELADEAARMRELTGLALESWSV